MSKNKSRKSLRNSKSRSKKGSKSQRNSKKNDSDDTSSGKYPQMLTRQTKGLVCALQAHVLPLLKLKSTNDDDGADELIGKNRILFALNRAAEQALKRRDIFGTLKQLRDEAREADDIVAEFLDKEKKRGYSKAKMSLVAPKCALCGYPCKRCNQPKKRKSKRKIDKKSRERSPKSISWGMDFVSNFERSEGEVPGAGFYPDPDSDSEDDDSLDSTRNEVTFDHKDFVKSRKGPSKPKAKSSKR